MKRLLLLVALCILFLVMGIRIGQKQLSFKASPISSEAEKYLLEYYPITVKTYFALAKFSAVDERYVQEKETDQRYAKAWLDLNGELKEIKKEDEKHDEPLVEVKTAVTLHRQGLQKVIEVTNKVADYLSGTTTDPETITESREEFVEGLNELKVASDLIDELLKTNDKIPQEQPDYNTL